MATSLEERTLDARRQQLLELGATEGDLEALLALHRPRRHWCELELPLSVTSAPPAHVEDWAGYADRAARDGAGALLVGCFPQLGFPVRAGMGQEAEYRAALQGRRPEPPRAAGFHGSVRIGCHPTPAGPLPYVRFAERADFVRAVRCLIHRNEPVAVPNSMGAALIANARNWDRIDRLKQRFLRGELAVPEGSFRACLQRLARERSELICDTIVLLSEGPYSSLDAGDAGVSEADWASLSRAIRIEHESGHYLTHRWLGFLSERPLDELALDSAACRRASGRGRPEWVRRFLGVEQQHAVRSGARLVNYCGPELSAGALAVEARLVRTAIENWEITRAALESSGVDRPLARAVLASAITTPEELATQGGVEHLTRLACRVLP